MPPTEGPSILKVSVHEKVVLKDVPPGNPAPTAEEIVREKTEELKKGFNELLKRYVDPPLKKTRWVVASDLQRLCADGRDMATMCAIPRGKYTSASAIAHSQIDNVDPLRFFVLPNGLVMINPVIVNHTKVPMFKREGCFSFPDKDERSLVPRYNKIVVMYQTLVRTDEVSDPHIGNVITEEMNGKAAEIFQHECDHLNGFSIYDEGFTAEKSIGLGDGKIITQERADKLFTNPQ